jgi:hypothetical protein
MRLLRRGIMFSTTLATVMTASSACEASSLASLAAFTSEVCVTKVLCGSNEMVSSHVLSLVQQELASTRLVSLARMALAAGFLVSTGVGLSIHASCGGFDDSGKAYAGPSSVILLTGEFGNDDESTTFFVSELPPAPTGSHADCDHRTNDDGNHRLSSSRHTNCQHADGE